MADEEQENIEVDITIPTEESDNDNEGSTDVEKEHLIDAAVDTGIAAGAANQSAADAQEAVFDAEDSARQADAAAAVATGQADKTERLLSAVETLTAQNAALIAALNGKTANEEASSILDNEELNPEVEIETEPSPEHWLNKTWFKGKK